MDNIGTFEPFKSAKTHKIAMRDTELILTPMLPTSVRYIPKTWKNAEVAIIPQQSTDYNTEAKAYYRISL
jgi:hypothetical protein